MIQPHGYLKARATRSLHAVFLTAAIRLGVEMGLTFFNTLGRKQQAFASIDPSVVRMYSCGPTVYNYAHIGNLRAYIFVDIVRRALEYLDYAVRHVMNITDVGHLTDDADDGEDKMVKSSRETGRSVWEIAEFYTDAFFRHADSLNITRPHVTPRATEHVDDMIALIRRLEERGYTYRGGGNIYFDISKFPSYGELARVRSAGGDTGVGSSEHGRVEVDPNKRNPNDFVLWFTQSKFENQAMLWDSPWGRGYPGWHIECSAMSMRYLGEQFDIHCGGVDHIPVHHSNEIAQSEAATGRQWVRYWLHNEFVVMDKGKMAKSSGSFVTLDTLTEAGYDPLDYRYFCLLAHYRSEIRFSLEALDAARRARLRLVERIRGLAERAPDVAEELGRRQTGFAGGMADGTTVKGADASGTAEAALKEFCAALEDDLNTPKMLAAVQTLTKAETGSVEEILTALASMDRVLGLNLIAEAIAEQQIPEEVEKLVAEREQARKLKDFARADEIRDILKERGFVLEDRPSGTKVSVVGRTG